MMHRGAIVFELMGRDALVAILNPYDAELRKEVESITGKECHFYMVAAESYDHCLDTIRAALKAEASKRKSNLRTFYSVVCPTRTNCVWFLNINQTPTCPRHAP